jgi:hypothetical protein
LHIIYYALYPLVIFYYRYQRELYSIMGWEDSIIWMGWAGNELTAESMPASPTAGIMGFWMGQQEKASAATLASSMYNNTTRPCRSV